MHILRTTDVHLGLCQSLHIKNSSMLTDHILMAFQSAVAIPKQDHADVNNYRQVSTLSILLSMLFNQLSLYPSQNRLKRSHSIKSLAVTEELHRAKLSPFFLISLRLVASLIKLRIPGPAWQWHLSNIEGCSY